MEAEETLFMTVAMVRCFFCEQSVWLPNGGMYTPGSEPSGFTGTSLLAFRCCGQMQLIPADKIYLEILRIAGVPA